MGKWTIPILGVLAAIAATSTMDVAGYYDFSAYILAPLVFLLWFVERLSRVEMGFVWGRAKHYLLGAAIPVVVMGGLAAAAALAGAVNAEHFDLRKVLINLAVLTIFTWFLASITEEGLFRGWLWNSLNRRGQSTGGIIAWTSVMFAAWHLSGVLAPAAAPLPPSQVAIYIANAAIIGAMWGILRAISGSIIVTSFSHGVWNGLAYTLFGEPGRVGALGIDNTAIFGPEVGLIGLILNVLALACLLHWWKTTGRSTSSG